MVATSELISARGLSVTFPSPFGPVQALDNIDLDIDPCEMLGLVGETGSGKSVLAHALLNMVRAPGKVSAGTIYFHGADMGKMNENELRRIRGGRISLIGTNAKDLLNPIAKIGDQIGMVLRSHQQVNAKEAEERAVAMLREVGIPEPERRARAYPHELSGGMAQRVVIAMALIASPELVISDDATMGLDVTVQRQVLDLMRDIMQRRNTSALLITHDLGIVAEYCKRVVVMRHGTIVEVSDVRSFLRQPQQAYSAQLLEASRAASRFMIETPCEELPTAAAPAADLQGSREELARETTSEPIVRVEHLVKHFPLRGGKLVVSAVNDVSFELGRGQTLGLVGESGSGKSTIGMCLVKLLEATSGRVRFEGQDITAMSEKDFHNLRRRVQMVFQEPYQALNPRRSVGQAIAEPLALLCNSSTSEQEERVCDLLTKVGLERSYRSRYPHQMTAGEQKRVGIARAIATNPDFLVLDEPTTALDITIRAQIVRLLLDLQHELGLSYIFISHDLTAVRDCAHRVAIMYLGQIVETGTTEQIFSHPLHPYSRALLTSVLTPEIGQKPSRFLLKGEIPSPINLPKGCFLHSRCPVGTDRCKDMPQQLETVEPGHQVACVRVQEGADFGGGEWRIAGKVAMPVMS